MPVTGPWRDLPLQLKPDNTYWAIPDVTNHHHIDYTSKPISLAVFNDRRNRKERKLLAYENCTVTELRGFVKARRLKLPTNSRRTKEDYITTLQTADDSPDLSRFFALAPPELREMVYKEYYAALPALPLNPHQPPLVLASSQLRQEALPLYYSECTFFLAIHTSFHQPTRLVAPVPFARAANPKTDLLFSGTAAGRLSAADLSRVRHFNLVHAHRGRRTNEAVTRTEWSVDLRAENGPVLSLWEDLEHWLSNWYWGERRRKFVPAIVEVLREIWARPGPGKLRQEDMVALRVAATMGLE
jgi:hypothetical protein